MKKLLLFMFAVVALAACEQAPIEEAQGVVMSDRSLEVSFDGADDTRIQLQNGNTVWTKGDHVSVFYRSTVNEEWQFMGETGDRNGQIVPVDNSVNPPATHNHVVVAYPYSADYFYNTETHNVEASLPAVQNYLKDSYGTNGNIMISSSEFNKVSLKSVCGWLKLQLTGDGEVVKSITLRGNDGEQVAGLIYVDSAAATATLASASGEAGDGEVGGTLVRPGTILAEVILDCGEGVALGKNATAFYISLPPQTFEQGLTVEIEDTEGYVMEQSTDKALTIERNHIQPMAAFEFAASVLNNQIWYTSSDGNIVKPENPDAFGANIISNKYDNGKGVITFDGDVTTIGFYAFAGCDSLTSVTIGDSVTSIGFYAFGGCESLTSVNIPDSVTTIGIYAFQYCDSLTSVTIGDSVTTIGDDAFAYCSSLTSVTIPDSVTTIGGYAFAFCDSLTEVYCYATVPPSLGSHAFGSNASGRRIYVYEECVEVYKSAWSDYKDSIYTNGQNCSETTTIEYTTNDGNIVTTQNMPVVSNIYGNGVGTLVVVGKISKIADYAFTGCESLTSVNIPDSVTTIGKGTFHSCRSLTSVNIPDSVTEIGERAFENCTSLTSVNIGDSVTSIGEWAFAGCTSLTSVNIPDSVTTIGYAAFTGCDSLTSVNIPDSVTSIGGGAFASCDSLAEFKGTFASEDGRSLIMDNTIIAYANASGATYTIPDSVTTIGNYAFYECTSLTSVTIPDSVTTIGWYAFYSCNSLTSVNIGDSVTTIGDYAFQYCDRLTSVYCKATTPPALGLNVFGDNDSGRKIYVPAGSVKAYKSATKWSEYKSAIVGYDFENGVVVE